VFLKIIFFFSIFNWHNDTWFLNNLNFLLQNILWYWTIGIHARFYLQFESLLLKNLPDFKHPVLFGTTLRLPILGVKICASQGLNSLVTAGISGNLTICPRTSSASQRQLYTFEFGKHYLSILSCKNLLIWKYLIYRSQGTTSVIV
jgi:hypothetical protein